MDKSWKKLFDQKTRTRGKEYAYYCIEDFVRDENGYSATVRGSENYKVSVSADYTKMSCSCPYAKDGKNCKHMAAVLYYEEILEKQKKEKERKAAEKVERQKLRASIEQGIQHGADCRRALLSDIQTVTEWKKKVNSLISHFKNKEGYIGYWEADSFIANLLDCFKTLYSFISVCADKKAIDASIWLYERIHNVGVDDSSTGCAGYFEDEMLSLWKELAEYSKENKELIANALQSMKNKGQAADDFLENKPDVNIDFEWDDSE